MSIFDGFKKIFKQVDEVKELRSRIKVSPNDPGLHQRLAERLIRSGEFSSAIEEYYTAAALFEKGGFGLKTIAVFKQCLKVDPSNIETVRKLIGALVNNGLSGDALFEFQKAIDNKDLFPDDKGREEFIGFSMELLGDAVEIHTYLINQSIKRDNRISVITSVEKCVPKIRTKKHFDQIRILVEKAAEKFSSPSDIWESYCLSLFAGGFVKEGGEVFHKMNEENLVKSGVDLPLDELSSYIEQVDSDLNLPRTFTSLESYLQKKLEEETPEEEEIDDSGHVAEGEAEEGEDFEDVLDKLREKVESEIGDEDLNARYNLGIAFKEMSLFEDAIREFMVSKGDDKIFLSSMLMLKECYESMEKFDEAMKILEELIKSGSHDDRTELELLYQKGSLYEKMGSEEEAKEYFQKVFDSDSTFKDIAEKVK